MRATLLAAALAALSSAAVEAAILTVTNNNDSGPGSLRAAVAASAAGDTITFDPAVKSPIVLTSGQIPIAHALTITGPGWRQLQIEGNANDRIFEILEASPAACPAPTGSLDYVVTISGLGLGNGARNTDNPGGAINAFHSLHLDSVVIYDSAARDRAAASTSTCSTPGSRCRSRIPCWSAIRRSRCPRRAAISKAAVCVSPTTSRGAAAMRTSPDLRRHRR